MDFAAQVLWIITIPIFLMFTAIFYKRALERQDDAKRFFFAAGTLLLGFGIRIFTGIYVQIGPIIFIGNVVFFLGMIPLSIHVEKSVFKKTRNLLSISAIIMFAIFIILSLLSNFNQQIMYVWVNPPFIINLLVIFTGYIHIIIKSTGNVRKSAIMILLGSILIIGSMFIYGIWGPEGQTYVPGIGDFLSYSTPILMIVGALITAKGFFGYS